MDDSRQHIFARDEQDEDDCRLYDDEQSGEQTLMTKQSETQALKKPNSKSQTLRCHNTMNT